MQESLFPKDKSIETLAQVADRLVAECNKTVRSAKTEEDLKMGFEKALAPILDEIGIKSQPEYEKTIYTGGRTDALHGQVIIEYKKPNAFHSNTLLNQTYNQLVEYIQGKSKEKKEEVFIFDPKLVGIGFDGEQIFFVHYIQIIP